MKCDPNKACVIYNENKLWALIHDAFAHPFMALTNYSAISKKIHDYTSHKAWTR